MSRATPRSRPLCAPTIPSTIPRGILGPSSFEKLLEQAGTRRDLALVLRRLGRCRQRPARSEHRQRLSQSRPRPATGWLPSTSPTAAMPPPRSRSLSAPTPTPLPSASWFRPAAKPCSASSSRASRSRCRSTTAPFLKPRPASISPTWAMPLSARPRPALPPPRNSDRWIFLTEDFSIQGCKTTGIRKPF